MGDTPVVERIKDIVRETVTNDAARLLKKDISVMIEEALEDQLPMAVAAAVDQQFTGKTSAVVEKAKRRPRCEECNAAMRAGDDGEWECRKCGK